MYNHLVSASVLCTRVCENMPYDDLLVHVCNNASVCTSVSQHERMHYVCAENCAKK